MSPIIDWARFFYELSLELAHRRLRWVEDHGILSFDPGGD